MLIAYLLIFGSMLLMGASAVTALWWAAKTGQFRNMHKGAESIFDSDEPVGRQTDMVFPVKKPKRKHAASTTH